MSWSFNVGATPKADLPAAVDAAETSPAYDTLDAEAKTQVAAAKNAAKDIADVFDGSLPVAVQVYGHACQDDPHGSGGSATDRVSVGVSEVAP